LLECHHNPLGLILEDSLLVCHAADMGAAQRVLRLLSQQRHRVTELNALEAQSLASPLKGTLHAWRLHGEGHLHPQRAMDSLYRAASSLSVQWRWQTPVTRLSPGVIELPNSQEPFDWVMDTRGLGAKDALSVRGVRGETIVLHAPGFGLNRAVRLLHPRWRVYIVPRPNHEVIIGATEIESEDRSPISVQSTMELLSAAFSIFPSLAEARIQRTDVNLRPATPDNLPFTEIQSGLIRINGLFRHGWLLAPAVIHLVKAELMKPQMEQRAEQGIDQRRSIEPRVSA
jgi:glycine oxidase